MSAAHPVPAPAPAPATAAPPGGAPGLTAIILTFNSAHSVKLVVEALRGLADRVLVVDSYSTDPTVAVVTALGCEVVQHPFEHYAAQRNWAQAHAALAPDAWVLHLDADEVVSPELAASIRAELAAPRAAGYLMRRISNFLGQPIRWGLTNPGWHLRLFRAAHGRCEDRRYDQHFILDQPAARLTGVLADLQLISVERWIATHNRWSTAEAEQIWAEREPVDGAADGTLQGSLTGDPRMRKRWMKNRLYYRLPLLLRAIGIFFYGYFLRLGFLDGRIGLIYHVQQTLWFRFTVDAKLYELELEERRRLAATSAPPAAKEPPA